MDRNYRKEIRRSNVRRLVELLTLAEVCRLTGMKRQQLAQYIQRVPTRSVGDKVAQRIEHSLKLPDGFIDIEQAPSRFEEILRGAALLKEDDASVISIELKKLCETVGELAARSSNGLASPDENKIIIFVAQKFASELAPRFESLKAWIEKIEISRLEKFEHLKAYFSDIREGQDVINTKLDLVLKKYQRQNFNGNNGNGSDNGEGGKSHTAKQLKKERSANTKGTMKNGDEHTQRRITT